MTPIERLRKRLEVIAQSSASSDVARLAGVIKGILDILADEL